MHLNILCYVGDKLFHSGSIVVLYHWLVWISASTARTFGLETNMAPISPLCVGTQYSRIFHHGLSFCSVVCCDLLIMLVLITHTATLTRRIMGKKSKSKRSSGGAQKAADAKLAKDFNNKLTITPSETASCWICLDDDPDDFGQPIRRECSCR
eukprot:scaffold744_cov93-Skeletonema_dohrnii-CCMP3373.AAC.1